MRVVCLTAQVNEAAFAKRAAAHFAKHPRHYTFAENDPAPGKLLAIRWNSFTVLVVKLDDCHEPACYPTNDLIQSDLPPREGDPVPGNGRLAYFTPEYEQAINMIIREKGLSIGGGLVIKPEEPARWTYRHEGD